MAKDAKQTQDPAKLYEAEVERLEELKREAGTLDHRRLELEQRLAEPRDGLDEAAEAYRMGDEVSAPPEFREELGQVRNQLRVVRRSVELQTKAVEEAKAKRDQAICDEAEEEITATAQDLAETAVQLSEAADRLYKLLDALDAKGVVRLHRFPGLRLHPLRASVPNSRMNMFISELIRDYGVEVERPRMEDTLDRERERHIEEQREKIEAGAAVAAGPDGIVEYLPGGKRKARA